MSLTQEAGLRRVVITGMGAISPAGQGVQALMNALAVKKCCIGPLTRFNLEGFEVGIAGEIPDYNANERGFTKKEARRLARFVQYAILASDEAIAQASFDWDATDLRRFGCFFGSGIGGLEEFERGCHTLSEKGPQRLNPLFIPTMISNMAAGNLSIRYGLRGECSEVVTACATGTHNIGAAYRSIRHGYQDIALAGGTEESITPVCIAGFNNLGALSKAEDPLRASLPFDVNRSGFVAGEGAGAVVLESLEHAQARGVVPLAEIVGFGATGDAYHMTAPDPEGEGLLRAMKLALAEGGFTPADLGHINAHGTATPMNDKTEAVAVAVLEKEAGKKIPLVSVKGCTGHTLGAAGALEAIVTALSLASDMVPATVGFSEADPECPVAVLREAKIDYPQKVALTNSLGFGGHNGSLAIAPYKG